MIIEETARIIPDKLIYKNEIGEIARLHKSLWIEGFKVYVDNNGIIEKIVVNGKHPNVDPETGILCLTDEIIGKRLEDVGFPMIYSLLSTYNLTHCFFRPWEKITMREKKEVWRKSEKNYR